MPIIIRDFEWKETETTLIIKVPLRGIHQSKVDLFYSHSYLKASFEQFFFEVFLLHAVLHTRSNCTITSSHIIFELIKTEPLIWGSLERTDLSRSEKLELKKMYVDEEQKRLQQESSQWINKKSELKRVAVREQMSLDADQRTTIDQIKEDEKTRALQTMELCKKIKAKPLKKIQPKIEVEPEKPVQIPPSRVSQTLCVDFTTREFPTPSRESKLEEETEWLKKQAAARRSAGFVSEDIRPEERNPQFLKAKGDEFMKNNNYLGAISAYGYGIKLNENFVDLYIARSEAHLAKGNFHRAAQDCSSALDLMKPAVNANLKERALCIGRRGVALVNLGLLREGIGELEASLKLFPSSEFEAKLQEAINQSDSS